MIQKYHFILSPFPAYHMCTQVNFYILHLKTYCKGVIFKGFFFIICYFVFIWGCLSFQKPQHLRWQ